jgi:hypothetical protein
MWAIFAAIVACVVLYYLVIGVCRVGFALPFLLRWPLFIGAVLLFLDVLATVAGGNPLIIVAAIVVTVLGIRSCLA